MTDLVCSARGCRAAATQTLTWRNPAIHDVDRRKVWLACDAHGAHLHEFLAARGFPVDVSPVDELADD